MATNITFPYPSAHVGKVIGPQGTNSKDMGARYGVKITVQKADNPQQPETMIQITGSDAFNVEYAKQEILLNLVDRRSASVFVFRQSGPQLEVLLQLRKRQWGPITGLVSTQAGQEDPQVVPYLSIMMSQSCRMPLNSFKIAGKAIAVQERLIYALALNPAHNASFVPGTTYPASDENPDLPLFVGGVQVPSAHFHAWVDVQLLMRVGQAEQSLRPSVMNFFKHNHAHVQLAASILGGQPIPPPAPAPAPARLWTEIPENSWLLENMFSVVRTLSQMDPTQFTVAIGKLFPNITAEALVTALKNYAQEGGSLPQSIGALRTQ